jgi:hypothetical protein
MLRDLFQVSNIRPSKREELITWRGARLLRYHYNWDRLKGKTSRRPFNAYYLEMTVVELQEDMVLRPHLDEFNNKAAAKNELLRTAE